jgi:hypothetical protein
LPAGANLLRVVAEDDVVITPQGAEKIVCRQHLESKGLQFQIANDARVQQAHHVREARGAETRAELLGHGRPAEDLAPFQNERLEAGLGEVGTTD